MNRSLTTLVLTSALCLALSAGCLNRPPVEVVPDGRQLEVTFNDEGCQSVTFNHVDLLADGKLSVGQAAFKKADDSSYTNAAISKVARGILKAAPDVAMADFAATAAWGSVQCVYAAQGNRLNMRIIVTNTSPDTLTELTLSPLELRLPPGINGGPVYAQRAHHNVGAPTILGADFGSGMVVLCNDDPVAPLTLSWEGAGGAARVNIHAGGEKMVYDEVYLRRPIAPGQADVYTISLRFAPAGADRLDVADDVCRAYGKAYPMTLKWPDRRPITRMFFGRGLPTDQVLANCRDPANAKAPTAAGRAFREKWRKEFQRAIDNAKAIDAQGIMMWSLEGESFPHATTYIGDPRCMKWLNPEMDLIADEMIGMIRAANLRPGVCVRPSRVVYARNDDPKLDTIRHSFADAKDAFLELDAKIQYCKARWKVSLFYIDTNFFYRHPNKDWALISADTWRRLVEKHPDVLLMPEHSYLQMYAYTAPYGQMKIGARETPELVRRIWPEAFNARQPDPLDPIAEYDSLMQIAQMGGIIITSYDTGRPMMGIIEVRREAAIRNLGIPPAIKRAGADVQKLLAAAGDPDLATRLYAAEALGKAKDPAVGEKLIALLGDEQWIVRKAAAVALGRQGDAKAIAPLARIMADPKGMDWIAARALQAIGPAAVPALSDALKADPRWDNPAVVVLGDMAVPEAVANLAAIVDKYKDGWRALQPALGALGKIGNEAAVDVLIRSLQSQGVGIRATAAEALGIVKDSVPRALKALQAALEFEKNVDKPNQDLINAINTSINQLKKLKRP